MLKDHNINIPIGKDECRVYKRDACSLLMWIVFITYHHNCAFDSLVPLNPLQGMERIIFAAAYRKILTIVCIFQICSIT